MQPGQMYDQIAEAGGYKEMRAELARFDDVSVRLFLNTLPLGLVGRAAVDEWAVRSERRLRLRWRQPRLPR